MSLDIILDADGQLQESNGDFATGENDNNLIFYIIAAHKGHYRTAPLIGVGIDKYLNSNTSESVIKADIKRNLENDIFKNPSIDLSEWPTIKVNKVTLVLS